MTPVAASVPQLYATKSSCRSAGTSLAGRDACMPRNAQPDGDAPSTTTTIRKPVRIAALGDLHCTRSSAGKFQTLFAQISESADMVLLAGDLTDTGHPEEARILARELSALRLPGVAGLGS